MRVAIIGMGVVGQAQARMFKEHQVVTYDPAYDTEYPEQAIAACTMAVICVSTPSPDGRADLTNFKAAVKALPYGLPILIRSTVPPGTTDAIGVNRLVAHAPEFLHERPGGSWRESTDVPFMILGGRGYSLAYFRPLIKEVFPGKVHECSPLTAELVKYTANLYWATRVTFVNEMAHVCSAFGGNWDEVRRAWLEDERVSPDYTAMGLFPPGFGGKCWPKDLAALLAASDEAGYSPLFLRAVQEANERFQA